MKRVVAARGVRIHSPCAMSGLAPSAARATLAARAHALTGGGEGGRRTFFPETRRHSARSRRVVRVNAAGEPVIKPKKVAKAKIDPNAVLQVPADHIRNFSIIAHIDHGKSTLADTLISRTGTVADRDMEAQLLDSMDIERERGITIKLNSARMNYTARNGETYVLNLIDTPGHVDFSYEVSRSLAACEGALLVVDASQGVEAQTVANVYLALDNDLEIIPVLNKIDLPGSEPDRVCREIEDVLGLDCSGAVQASAKANIGMEDILEQLVELVPPPPDTADEPLRALIFDSYFDIYRGVVCVKEPATTALDGYAVATPMVYCGLFPTDSDRYDDLREALGKLQINDAALCYEPEQSSAMGFGFRCGFLGLLHMEIVQERLEREYNLDLITTAPSVVYKVYMNDADKTVVDCANPAGLPDAGKRDRIEEPYVTLELITPADYVGSLMELSTQRRGEFIDMTYLSEGRTCLKYEIPLGEVVTDFFDELKSRSKGYASMEYQFLEYRKNDMVRLDVMINGEPAEPLACIVHKDKAYSMGRGLVDKLKELIPRQMFRIPIQAAIGAKVIASTSISAMRKDVLAKCYGGDISRKKKLLKKQAAGKKRMKQFGKVEVPQEAFMAVLQVDQNAKN